jgi:hypothetical protein
MGVSMSNKVTGRIRELAFEILRQYPEGLRSSDLRRRIKERDNSFNENTIRGCIWNLDTQFPTTVYKPARGHFRLAEFRER